MTRPLTGPADSSLTTRVEAFVAHLERHRDLPPHLRLATAPPAADPTTLPEALERLQLEHEQLAVAGEELKVQLDAMAASERVVAAERMRYREVFDFAPDPLLVSDRQGVIQEANLAALQMLSIEARHLAGKPLLALVGANDRRTFLGAFGQLAAARSIEVSLELEGRRGAQARVDLRGALMRDGSRILWSAREAAPAYEVRVTGGAQGEALRRALYEQAEALRRAQREKSELAVCLQQEREAREAAEARVLERDRAMAVLGHELRGPANIVLGWAKLLRGGAVEGAERAKALETIERQARSQFALIDELLDAAVLAAGRAKLRLDVTDVGALVCEVTESVRPAAEGKALKLACATTPGLLVLGDRERLAQVVTNLLSNAIKFTPEGGRVSVRCEPCEPSSRGRALRVLVEDTGRGLEPGELDVVFGFLRQGDGGRKHPRSLGLGLYLVRQFVELHGGTVVAESEGPAKGTRFTVTLPSMRDGHAPTD